MELVEREIKDKRVMKLIKLFLQSGVMINEVVMETEEDCPRGSPICPLFGNIKLNEIDRELERWGHIFCRYVDDCNIYIKSRKSRRKSYEKHSKILER